MSSDFWEQANHTELYQLCKKAGLDVSPGMTRETLGQLLEGSLSLKDATTIDAWRDAIMAFINDFWPKLQSQITCPARSRDPKACYGCLDTQVVACLTKNPRVYNEIKKRKIP